jgi:hypothetical protein
MLVMRLKNLLPALKVVVGSPPYEAKYEDSVVPDHKGDSDDEYEKKDTRTMNEILLESKADLIQDKEMVMFLDKLIECLMPAFQLLRLADGSQICAGEIWRQAWKVQEHIAKFDEVDGLENSSALWSKRWKQFHHPADSLAYFCNPRHFGCDQLEDASVKKDVETMLKRFFPDRERRGHVTAAMNRFLKKEGNFTEIDRAADARTVWADSFIAETTPWDWYDGILLEEPEPGDADFVWAAQRVLRLGVSSSINERIFSHWKNIMGSHRTRLGKKRQRDQVFVYSNERVLKRCMDKQSADLNSDEEDLAEEEL